jgi:diguanylate cyclase (GGDEF)-like protein/PAS domain S-box-containing protein
MISIGRRHGGWLALAAMVIVCLLGACGLLRPLENAVADLRARVLDRQVASPIVIVGIDSRSVAAFGHRNIPRRQHARLLEELARAAPRGVFLDFDLSEPAASAADDAALDAALARRRNFPVILPIFVRHADAGTGREAIGPLPRFARSTDLDGVVTARRDGEPLREWHDVYSVGDERTVSVVDPHRQLPQGRPLPIDYSISPQSFIQVSWLDVLEHRVPPDVFTDRMVFVGVTVPGHPTAQAVPVYGELPGVLVHAIAAESLSAGALQPAPVWMNLALLGLAALLGVLLYGADWRRNLGALALLWAAIAAISIDLWLQQRVLVATAAPLLVVLLLHGAASVRWFETRMWRSLALAIGVRHREVLVKSMVQSSTDCIVCMDDTGIVKLANPAAARLFGCAASDLVGEPLARFITLLAGDGPGARLAGLHGEIRECDARTLEGEVFPVEISVSRVRVNASRLYTAIVRDIRERRAQTRHLQHQATHDSLTTLPNRAALLAQLERALAPDRSQPTIALLMLDLCRFKEVNDTLGHNVGDRVLCEVAQRFQQALGDRGFIARIGGDEFTVVIDRPHSTETIANTSQALADCLRTPIDVAGISIEVGVSIGIARFPQDASEPQTLLRHADVAMYVAKRRNSPYEFYDSAHDENSLRKLAIGGELRSAIASHQFTLHYQPQINLRTGMVDSVEALVRWFHPTLGAIAPGEFIAIAESTDLIRPLTEWTLGAALAQVRAWRERGVHVRVAVNLSSRLLQDMGFPARLSALIAASGVAAASLELEITESAMMLDPARALRVIQEIDKLGVFISIDDFGTGYSSLGYLRDLPVHALKLDKSFVAGMRNNADDRIIVESTAQMAHAMRLELVAEGVETEWDAQFLASAGYDYAQGFRYSGALPAEQCLAWMVEFNATALLAAGDGPLSASLHHRAHPAIPQTVPGRQSGKKWGHS